MHKIGTGDNGTIAGKVYLFLHSDKGSSGYWTYCKGKLYLRVATDKLGVISVISPETFQKIGTLKLCCGEAFKNSAAANFNRNYPLLTDGENLYAIVVTFKKIKRKVKEDMKKEYEDFKKSEEENQENAETSKRQARIKHAKKPQALEDAKICEFHLVEFDVEQYNKDNDKPVDASEANLLEEIYDGFSGYFTYKECLRALRAHDNSIEAASRWLLEQGDNEKGQTVIQGKRWVLLGQSLIRTGRDNEVVEGSVLNPNSLSSQWTMNKSQVTLHLSPSIAKIFSIKESDIKAFKDEKQENMKEQAVYNDIEDVDEEESEGDREGEKFIQQVKNQSEIHDKYFEDIELEGSFICTLTSEPLDYERYSITYSLSQHKFYALSLDSSSITVLLEYGNIGELNRLTIPEVLRKNFEETKVCSSPIDLANSLFKLLKEAETYRYCLPWKWNNWATLYQKAYDSLSARSRSSDSDDTDSKKKSNKLAKLKQRAEHFKELQQEKLLVELGIKDLSDTSSMKLPKAVMSVKNDMNRPASRASNRLEPRNYSFPSRGVRHFESYGIRRPAFFEDHRNEPAPIKSAKEFVPKLREEKQEMQVVVENLKEPAFCSSGSWTSLKLLLKGIKTQEDIMLLKYYDQLLIWIIHCGVFSNYEKIGNPDLIKEVFQYLLSIIKGEVKHKAYNEEIQSYVWRILINGWQIFITTAELQSFIFQQIMKLPLGKLSTNSYYEIMLNPASTPFELFYCKHLQYPCSFYSNFPLQQPHIQIFQLASKVLEGNPAGKKGKPKEKVEFIDITNTNHNKILDKYKIEEYLPKVSALLVLPSTPSTTLEDYSLSSSNITLDERIKFYSNVAIPDEDEKHKKVFLEKIRSDHNLRVKENWNIIKDLLISSLNKSSDEAVFIWSTYNKLILNAVPIFNSEFPTNITMIKEIIDFAEFLIDKYKEVKKEAKIWLDQLFEHLFWIVNYLHASKFENDNAIIIPNLMNLLLKINELVKDMVNPVLVEAYKQDAQSVDYLHSKVFETSHPYGRRESSRKEVFAFPGAIAIYCELDKRSRSENSNDYLSIYTNGEMHAIYDYLGTGYRIYNRNKEQGLYILYGDTVDVSFQVNSPIQKVDPVTRWGFKITFRPIYGEPEKCINKNNEDVNKISNKSAKKLLLSVKTLTRCITELIEKLIKGGEIKEEEKECQKFFEFSLAKEGLKFSKAPSLAIKEKPKEEKTKEKVKKDKKYKLNTKVVDPKILKVLKESEQNKGWLVDLVTNIRQITKYPDLYLIEKRYSSFTKEFQEKWEHTERICALALLYHMDYPIEDSGVKINEERMERVGQALNEILRFMLRKLAGLKEYYYLKLAFLEECANCYETFLGKLQEETKVEEKPKSIEKKPKKGTVIKTRSKRKKLILAPSKPEDELKEVKVEKVLVSQLPLNKRTELKSMLYERTYDVFMQRYQGSTDLLRSICEAMGIVYNAKDHANIQRNVFIKLQEGLKSIVNLESAHKLPDTIPTTLPNEKNPYDSICSRIIKESLFLLELNIFRKDTNNAAMKSENRISKRKDSEEEMFNDVLLKKSLSLQPFLEGAKTDTQTKKAVDDYLKWKRSKCEETAHIADTATQNIISVITSSYSPKKLRKSFKLQEKRGMRRELGLKYLLDLTSNYGMNGVITGSIVQSIPNGSFSNIEGCSPTLTASISSYATRFALKIINTLVQKFDDLEKDKKNLLREEICKESACSYLKEILYLLVEFNVLVIGLGKADIIKMLYKISSKNDISGFIGKVLDIMLIVQEYLVQLGYPATISLLSTYIEKSCRNILDNFIKFASEKINMQNEIVDIILSSLGSKKSIENIELLLKFLHETLVLFDIAKLDPKVLSKCSSILKSILISASVPTIIKNAGKCCKLIFKSLPVEDFVNSSIQRIGKLALIGIEGGGKKDELIPEDRLYYVILHLNSKEDNPTFVLTALYHLENMHPSFTKSYPKNLEEKERGWQVKGPFDNTPLFMQKTNIKSTINLHPKTQQSSVVSNISRQFEEIVKLTQEDIKEEDSPQEKLRKLNEYNYNKRISQHLSDAKTIYNILSTRSFVQYPIPVTYKEALELAEVFEKAYNKKLEQIPINPYMTAEAKQKKLSTGATVQESFPLTQKQPANTLDSNYPIPPAIIIAKERFITSLCEKSVFKDYFTHATKIKSKKILDRVKYIHLKQPNPVIGVSFSICITTMVNLLREFVHDDSDERWNAYIKKCVDKIFDRLGNDIWESLSEESKEETIGTLTLVSGWFDYIRPGAKVEAVVNNNKEKCTIISGGLGTGSQTARVVIKDDPSLAVHSIPLDCIKLITENKLYTFIDQSTLSKALLNIQKQCKNDIATPEVLRLLLLKIAIKINWKTSSKELMELVIELARHNTSAIIKRANEDNLAKAWEKLIEKADSSESLFFVPPPRKVLTEVKEKPEIGKLGKLADLFEYVQPVSSYQKSLSDTKANPHSKTESALKLLDYWEKHIIPAIQRMVRNVYKPWEKDYYFEQLRDGLRKENIDRAMQEILVMCDQQLPAECILPKDNRDWSAFTAEECIAGTWASATLNINRNHPNPVLASFAERILKEVPVIIKATDWEIQAAFCEYNDPDTGKKIGLLIPIDSLREPERPLLESAVIKDYDEVNANFRQILKDLTASFALKAFVAMYDSCQLASKNLPNIVHWIVMDELREDNVEGWMKYAKPILELPKKEESKEDIAPKAIKEVNNQSTIQETSPKLTKVEDQIRKLGPDQDLQKWCIETWQKLASMNASVIINLSQVGENASNDQTFTKAIDGNAIFPLHELITNDTDYGACIITFEVSAFLTSNSKLKFFSDASGQCLVAQMNAGKTQLQFLAPLVINHGKVWCHFHQGTVANLSKELQKSALPSSLPCCVTFIPALWTTVCWVSETLTNIMLEQPSIKVIEEFYKPLVGSMCNFLQEDAVPSILKQLAFVLLNRILQKMRCIYNMCPYTPGSCFEKLGLNKEWFILLIEKLNKMKGNEDSADEAIYSEFIQDASELIATALLPFDGNEGAGEIESQKIIEELNLPDWMRAIIDIVIFLHYFRKEGKLTKGLTQDILKALSLNNQLENIILIKNLPKAFNVEEIKAKLIDIFTSHKVRIVDPRIDIVIPTNGTEHTGFALIVTDGFELGNKDLFEKSPEKEEPQLWMCSACTFYNQETSTACVVCESPKQEAPRVEGKDTTRVKNLAQDEYDSMMWGHLYDAIKGLKCSSPKKSEESKSEQKDVELEPEIMRSERLFSQPLDSLLKAELKNRLCTSSTNQFSERVKDILTKIFEVMMKVSDEKSLTPKEHPEYNFIGIGKKVTVQNADTFIKKVFEAASRNPVLVWELIIYYGYDLWLQKSNYFSEKELPDFFKVELLEKILTMCEVEICKETKMIMQLNPTYLHFSPPDKDPYPMINGLDEHRLRIRYPGIFKYSLDEIRYNWSILKKFNDRLTKAIPFINWNVCVNVVPENSIPLTISSFLSAARKLCLGYVKMKLQHAVFSKTAVVREAPPKMVFERLKFDHKEDEKVENEKEESMFYKAYEQIKNIDLTLLRAEKPVGSSPFLAFEVIFKGEYVVGEGGPYRQFFADISTELQPSPSSPGFTEITNTCLNLLCPTPNTINKQGDAKDKFTLTPSAKSTKDLLLYEFLGLLMGCCMRTGVRLSLDLASIIWKQIVREPLSLSDLEEVDNSVVGMLKFITGEGLESKEFESIFTETFTAMLSDTSSIELLPNGANIPVTFDRREEYAELLLKARLNESAVQCKAIRKGISLVVPEAMLSFLTHQEVASLICGKPVVDLQMLRRHTRYSKGISENSEHVKYLWEVLEELSETDKLRFIKFCWGQERLPANDEEYEERQVRLMIKSAVRKDNGKEEDALPKADTCFFNLELPKYSSKEKLKEKLMLAIYTDFVSMNADDNPSLDPRHVPNAIPYDE